MASEFPPEMNTEQKPPEVHSDDDVHDSQNPSASNTDLNSPAADEARKKSLAFYLSFVAILINLFLYALDATTLAVATPVS